MTDYLILTAVGALLHLDRLVPQLLFSRPIVAGPLLGLILGDFLLGLLLGSLLELFWIDREPIGGYVTPDDSLVTIVGTGVLVIFSQTARPPGPELVFLTILFFLPLAYLGQKVEVRLQKRNSHLAKKAERESEQGNVTMVERVHLQSLAEYVGFFAVIIFLISLAGVQIITLLDGLLPDWSRRHLGALLYLLPSVGIAAALQAAKFTRILPLLIVFVAGVVVLFEWPFSFP